MKVLIVYNTMEYVWYRRFFLTALLTRGHEVIALGPFDGWETKVATLGVECRHLRISRRGARPWQELVTLYDIFLALRREAPDAMILYTMKPIIYGSVVARLTGLRRVFSLVTGLGYMFAQAGRLGRLRQAIARLLYRLALGGNEQVLFQNPDDMSLFVEGRIVDRDRCTQVPGSGVDTNFYAPRPEATRPGHFLLVSRMLWDKGVALFVAAAERLKPRYPEAEFTLLGPRDDNPSAIPEETLRAWNDAGAVRYLGAADDVRPTLATCSVYVLPSYYREGIPRTNLEALAMGKAIVTTDAPGCRETAVDGLNGFMVPPRDEDALVEAMERFLLDPSLAMRMGAESRRLALERFPVEAVNRVFIELLEGDPR